MNDTYAESRRMTSTVGTILLVGLAIGYASWPWIKPSVADIARDTRVDHDGGRIVNRGVTARVSIPDRISHWTLTINRAERAYEPPFVMVTHELRGPADKDGRAVSLWVIPTTAAAARQVAALRVGDRATFGGHEIHELDVEGRRWRPRFDSERFFELHDVRPE